MRTSIVLIIIVIVILVAGTLLYFFFIKGEGDPWSDVFDTDDSSGNTVMVEDGEVSAPITEEQAVEQLSSVSLVIDTESLGATLTEGKDEIIYYDTWDQGLKKVSLAGNNTDMPYVFGNIPQEIIWSSNRQSYVYRDESGQYYFGELGREEILLGINIESPVFCEEGDLWYRSVEPDQQTSYIKIGNPASGLTDSLEIIPASGSVVLKYIPNRSEIAYYLTPSVHRSAGVYFMNQQGEKQLAVNKGMAMTASWSPGSNYLAFTRLGDGERVTLWLADDDGKNSRQLEKSTFVDKITWSSDDQKMYLAVPKLMPTAQSYFDGTGQIEDRLYEIDMASGESKELVSFSDLAEKIDARDIFLSKNDKILYFRNSYNDSIYAVNLEKI